MNTLEEWTAAVCAKLGLDPTCADTTIVLDVARDVAHGVARPAPSSTPRLVDFLPGSPSLSVPAVIRHPLLVRRPLRDSVLGETALARRMMTGP